VRWGSNGTYLSPWLLQLAGLALLVGSGVFWALTGRESVLMVSSAMTLIAGGALRGAFNTARADSRNEDTP
jgi:hypothetical protein